MEVEAECRHADAAQLDVYIRALGKLGNIFAPTGKNFLPPSPIGSDAQYPADMVENDRGIGEGAGQIDRVRQLRMILPRFEAEVELRELCKPLTEIPIQHQVRRHDAGRELADDVAGVPGHSIADATEAAAGNSDLGF